ncbi:hypothetical protein FALB51S_03244 [Frigidibacter albus]
MPDPVQIFEVGPRDGLQNESRMIPAAEKIALVDCLSRAGFRQIEVASFVSPRWVPQMADGAEVLAGITRAPGVAYSALTPNLKGYEGARAARADAVAVFAAASEGFSRANLNCTIAESLARFAPVMEAARADGIPVRGYVSVVTDCPYDGAVAPGAVARVAAALLAMGCTGISLGDTIGRATPEAVAAMLQAVLQEVPAAQAGGAFPRYGRPRAAEYRGLAGHGAAGVRRGGGRAWWLPLCPRRQGQCGDRTGGRAPGGTGAPDRARHGGGSRSRGNGPGDAGARG